MTKKQEIKELAKMYGVKVRFVNIDTTGSCAYVENAIHLTNKNISRVQLLSTFFHELGHIYCYLKGKYKQYHYSKSYKNLTKKEKKAIILTGYRAEKYVERFGENELKKLYPHLKYRDFYGTEYSRLWLYNNYLKKYYS